MADVAHLPGLFEQIWLVAGLRWRILRNNMKNKNRVWDVIGVVISSVVGIVFVAGIAILVFVGNSCVSERSSRGSIRSALLGIFLWWQVLPIFVAGFSPSFSFRSLLRFPLKFAAFYSIGLAYGLADSAALASLVWLVAMVVAAMVTRISVAPAMILASALFVAVNVTLERLIGSWLEKILAKRKAREIFLALFVLFIVGVQFIGPAIQKYGKSPRPDLAKIIRYARPSPPSLAGELIAGAAAGDSATAGIGAAGLAGYAVLLGGLLFFRYRDQFRGEELSETVAPARAAAKSVVPVRDAAGPELRLLPVTVAAVLGKEFRYLFRNGFVATALFFPPMLVLLFSMQFGGRASDHQACHFAGSFFPRNDGVPHPYPHGAFFQQFRV